MIVEIGCHLSHGLAGVRDDYLGDVGGVGQVHLALDHQGGGAVIDGILGEAVAVHHVAHDAEEHIAGLHLVAAKRQSRYLLVGVADNGAFHALEQFSTGFGHR